MRWATAQSDTIAIHFVSMAVIPTLLYIDMLASAAVGGYQSMSALSREIEDNNIDELAANDPAEESETVFVPW